MQRIARDLLPREEGQERQRDEQQRVLDRTLAALIDVDSLIEADAESGLIEHRFVHLVFAERLAIRAIQLQHLPACIEAILSDRALGRQERAVERRMWPVGMHLQGRRAPE